jgi:hypothetical protein
MNKFKIANLDSELIDFFKKKILPLIQNKLIEDTLENSKIFNSRLYELISSDPFIFLEYLSTHPDTNEEIKITFDLWKKNVTFLHAMGHFAYVMPVDKIKDLIKKIRPIKTEFELIRLGTNEDGGYLVPDDLTDIACCVSPGVGQTVTFETDLLNRFGIGTHSADGTITELPLNFKPKSYIKKNVNAFNDDQNMTLENWCVNLWDWSLNKDMLLQMDIEGAEYEVLLSTPDYVLKKFRIVVIEIHRLEQWPNPGFLFMVEALFNKLLQHFYCVHIHPNNVHNYYQSYGGINFPGVMEITFHRKDRIKNISPRFDFPHKLDFPNSKQKPDHPLPEFWYKD